jgi:hypothetical protein
VDIVTIMQTLSPFKAGIGMGVIVLIYGSKKMEFLFGIFGFFLCLIAGFLYELLV